MSMSLSMSNVNLYSALTSKPLIRSLDFIWEIYFVDYGIFDKRKESFRKRYN